MPTPDIDRQKLNSMFFYAVVLVLGYLAYQIVQPFLVPIAWAGILTLITQPLHRRLTSRLKPGVAAALVTVLVALVLVVPAIVLALMLMGEAPKVMANAQAAIDGIRDSERLQANWTWVQAHVPLPSLEVMKARLVAGAGQMTGAIASQAGAILKNVAEFLFMLFITLVGLFFFLRDSAAIGRAIKTLLPFEESRKTKLIAQARELVYASAITMLSVASVQGLVGGILFAILGIEGPAFWGLTMAICAFIPLAGTSVIWVPAAIWLYLHGAWIKAVILAVGGVVLVSGVDNVLRPWLMSGRSSMNVLLILVSLLGGLAAFGFIGLILGPVVMATVVSLLSLDVETAEK